ncbi:hypothetical protein DMB92_09130, partial [Campylobacter sp. MIT 99-7217]
IQKAGFNSETKKLLDEFLGSVDEVNLARKQSFEEALNGAKAKEGNPEIIHSFIQDNGNQLKTDKVIPLADRKANSTQNLENLQGPAKVLKKNDEEGLKLRKEFKTILDSLEATQSPKELNEQELKELLESFDNPQNIEEHLASRKDAKQRQAIFHLTLDTMEKPNFKYVKEGKTKYIKKFQKAKNEPFYYLLITKDEDRTFITHLKTRDYNYLQNELLNADEILKGADIIATLRQQAGDAFKAEQVATSADNLTNQSLNPAKSSLSKNIQAEKEAKIKQDLENERQRIELENLEATRFNHSGNDLVEQPLKSKDTDTTNFDTPIKDPEVNSTQNLDNLQEKEKTLNLDERSFTRQEFDEPKQKQLFETLKNYQGSKVPKNISIDEFLNTLSEVENKNNFVDHLLSKQDAEARLSFLNLVEPSLKDFDVKITKVENGQIKEKMIKKFSDDKDFFYLLVSKDDGKILLTGFKTDKMNTLLKEFKDFEKVELNADIIQTFIQQGSKQDKQGLGYQNHILKQNDLNPAKSSLSKNIQAEKEAKRGQYLENERQRIELERRANEKVKESRAKEWAKKEALAGKAANDTSDLSLKEPIKHTKIKDTKLILDDEKEPINLSLAVVKKEDLKESFEKGGTQGRSEKQDKKIKSISLA